MKIFDFLGHRLNFEHESNSKFKSIQGSILSLGIVITTTVLACLFGRDIYERKIPIIMETDSTVDSSTINSKDLPIFFRIMKNDVLLTFEESHQWVDAYVNILTLNKNNKITTELHSIKKCAWNEYPNYELQLNAIKDEQNYACFDYQSFNGQYMTTESSTISITFNLKQGLKEPGGNSNYKLVVYHGNSLIDNKNFLKPVNSYIANMSLHISPMIKKFLFLRFTNDMYISDNGWIIENNKYYPHIKLNNLYTDYAYAGIDANYKISGISVILESPLIQVINARYYIKIQELIAKVGGVINGLMVFVYVLFSNYFRFSFIQFLREEAVNHLSYQQPIMTQLENIREVSLM